MITILVFQPDRIEQLRWEKKIQKLRKKKGSDLDYFIWEKGLDGLPFRWEPVVDQSKLSKRTLKELEGLINQTLT